MKPNKGSDAVRQDGLKSIARCIRCVSETLFGEESSFPRFGIGCWIAFGCVDFVFRYSFVMPSDTSAKCLELGWKYMAIYL